MKGKSLVRDLIVEHIPTLLGASSGRRRTVDVYGFGMSQYCESNVRAFSFHFFTKHVLLALLF